MLEYHVDNADHIWGQQKASKSRTQNGMLTMVKITALGKAKGKYVDLKDRFKKKENKTEF